MEPVQTGAFESHIDSRTVKLEETLASPLISGGVDYFPQDIEHQHKVGICTAISRVQLRQKQTGKKYSPDFQYLLQKKFYDGNWQEGSSILYANKVAKNIGFLPIEEFPYVDETYRYLPYSQYIAKLQAIPNAEIERLKGLCVDKIAGYASVNVSDPQSMAKAIDESQAGILCRYNVGENWYTPSWEPKDINPLRPPVNPTSGHAIIMSKFDYSIPLQQKLANTWGILWDMEGCADINWSNYKPTEAWADLNTTPVIPSFKHNFLTNLTFGDVSSEVKNLQIALQLDGEFPTGTSTTNLYGNITRQAVLEFQRKYKVAPEQELINLNGKVVGPATRKQLNLLFNK